MQHGPPLPAGHTATTDGAGKYVFSNLSPNPYHITVQAQGFQTLERDVDALSRLTDPTDANAEDIDRIVDAARRSGADRRRHRGKVGRLGRTQALRRPQERGAPERARRPSDRREPDGRDPQELGDRLLVVGERGRHGAQAHHHRGPQGDAG